MFRKDLKIKQEKGFSLIELIVATAIFASVIAAAVGIFVSALKAQDRTLAYQQLLDSTSYTAEYMSRALRMARKDDIGVPPVDCFPSDSKINYKKTTNGIRFRDYNDKCHEFYLSTNPTDCGGSTGCLMENIEGVYTSALPITPNDLNIDSFNVFLSGETQADNLQPKVTFTISAKVKNSGQPNIKVQTTVSQRNLDAPY